MKISLLPKAAQELTFQQYGANPDIEGVFYRPLKKFRALEGYFMEFVRISDSKIEGLPLPFEVRQISFAHATPHRINAFHVHPKEIQDELWCVVEGVLMVWLVDVREKSRTAGVKRKYVLNAEESGILYIPTGVAHGYKAGPQGALLVYAMNSQFNLQDPNEGRLPWDYFGKELWEEDRG